MWCIIFTNKNKEILHMVCFKDKPSSEDINHVKKEIKEDPEFNHIVKEIKYMNIKEIDMDYNDIEKKVYK